VEPVRNPVACPDCERLRAQVLDLQIQVRALRRMIDDLTGLPTKDDPYDDEHHPVWEKEWDK